MSSLRNNVKPIANTRTAPITAHSSKNVQRLGLLAQRDKNRRTFVVKGLCSKQQAFNQQNVMGFLLLIFQILGVSHLHSKFTARPTPLNNVFLTAATDGVYSELFRVKRKLRGHPVYGLVWFDPYRSPQQLRVLHLQRENKQLATKLSQLQHRLDALESRLNTTAPAAHPTPAAPVQVAPARPATFEGWLATRRAAPPGELSPVTVSPASTHTHTPAYPHIHTNTNTGPQDMDTSAKVAGLKRKGGGESTTQQRQTPAKPLQKAVRRAQRTVPQTGVTAADTHTHIRTDTQEFATAANSPRQLGGRGVWGGGGGGK